MTALKQALEVFIATRGGEGVRHQRRRHDDDLDIALGEYERLRLWHIRLYQAVSWLFTPAYQSDSAAIAWLRDAIVSPLSRLPPGPRVLAGLVAGAWGAPLDAMLLE